MSVSAPAGGKPIALQLSRALRYALYAVTALLFLTGAGWWIADRLKETDYSETSQSVAVNLLMLHGGAAMIALLLFGAMFPIHVQQSWQRGKNRIMGLILLAVGAILIATAFGLYYSGSDIVRPWVSWIHLMLGLALPVLLLFHIVSGRRVNRA